MTLPSFRKALAPSSIVRGRGKMCFPNQTFSGSPQLPSGSLPVIGTYSSPKAAPVATAALPSPSFFRNSRFVICIFGILPKPRAEWKCLSGLR